MRNLPIAERIHNFGTSVFTEISALAVQHNAVNLGQGFPDFAGPTWIKQAAIDAIAADLNQYAPTIGLPVLRAAIASQWARHTGRTLDPNTDITVTSGATEALFATMQALLNPGDEVICFEPFYDAYVPDICMAGGIPRFVRLYPPSQTQSADYAVASATPANAAWRFDRAELSAAFTQRTRLFLLNTPHNPTGKVFTKAELEDIAGLCRDHNVIIITDEVYDQLVYDNATHISIATLPDMWERTLTINSTGKTFSLTGWKIGYTIGPSHLNDAVRRAHQWITFATATPLQYAAAVALETALAQDYYTTLRAEYRERRDLLAQTLQTVGLPTLPVEGSYFIMADIAHTNFKRDVDFCRWLTCEVGVAAIPPSAFYARAADAPLLARFCFAKKLETIHAAAQRMKALTLQTQQ